MAEDVSDEHQDHLPEELDVTAYVGPYVFPNINRRRIPAVMYAALAVLSFAGWIWSTNTGLLAAAVLLAAISAYHLATAWNLAVDQTQALVVATRTVGFPVGHASAQLAWRGLRSRPVWRILLYSAEDPPDRRGVVLVDGVNGEVLFDFVEANPEDWSTLAG